MAANAYFFVGATLDCYSDCLEGLEAMVKKWPSAVDRQPGTAGALRFDVPRSELTSPGGVRLYVFRTQNVALLAELEALVVLTQTDADHVVAGKAVVDDSLLHCPFIFGRSIEWQLKRAHVPDEMVLRLPLWPHRDSGWGCWVLLGDVEKRPLSLAILALRLEQAQEDADLDLAVMIRGKADVGVGSLYFHALNLAECSVLY